MNNKTARLSLYLLSLSTIFLIVYFWGLPIQQHHIFKKINNGINTNNVVLSPSQEKILAKRSSEKEPIIIYSLSIAIKEYEENSIEVNEVALNQVLLNTENYIDRNPNWYVKPDIYMKLSYAYLLMYKKYNTREFKDKSIFYSEKSFALFPNRDDIFYKYFLTKIQLNTDKEESFAKIKARYEESKDLNLNIHDYYMGLAYYYMNDNKNSILYLDKFSKYSQPKEFIQSKTELKNIYYDMLKDFYKRNDLKNTQKTLERLISLDDQNKDFFSYIQNYIKEKGHLPNLKLNY